MSNKMKKLIFLTLVLTALIAFSACKQIKKVEYNNFIFEPTEVGWRTEIEINGQPLILELRYNPYQVENVPISGKINEIWNNQSDVYVTFDPTAPSTQFKWLALGAAELSISLARALGRNVIAACTKNETAACSERPIVDCTHLDKAVILLESQGEAEVIAKENCILIKGEGEELIKAVDKVLYKFYKIAP